MEVEHNTDFLKEGKKEKCIKENNGLYGNELFAFLR